MRSFFPLVYFGFAVVCVAAASGHAVASDVLASREIATQLIGQPFHYRGREDGERKEGRIIYAYSGTIYIRTRQGYLDGGTWKISNGKLCTRITLGRSGARKCFSVSLNSDGYYATSHNYRLYPIIDDSYKGT